MRQLGPVGGVKEQGAGRPRRRVAHLQPTARLVDVEARVVEADRASRPAPRVGHPPQLAVVGVARVLKKKPPGDALAACEQVAAHGRRARVEPPPLGRPRRGGKGVEVAQQRIESDGGLGVGALLEQPRKLVVVVVGREHCLWRRGG